jgi:hypothetical protein
VGKNIKFTNITDFKDLEKPKPASAFIPNWYKNMESYMGGKKVLDGNGFTTSTIKRCLPVFDAMTAGYIITSPADIMVTLTDEEQYFQWANFSLIQFHPIEQAPNHPMRNMYPYPKWINPWSIETPKGYSTLFVQPFHRDCPFIIFPGVVDTDKYNAPVNFPFVLKDDSFEGLIPAGTPIAQVIPFKRKRWSMKIDKKNNYHDSIDSKSASWFLQIFIDKLKNKI